MGSRTDLDIARKRWYRLIGEIYLKCIGRNPTEEEKLFLHREFKNSLFEAENVAFVDGNIPIPPSINSLSPESIHNACDYLEGLYSGVLID